MGLETTGVSHRAEGWEVHGKGPDEDPLSGSRCFLAVSSPGGRGELAMFPFVKAPIPFSKNIFKIIFICFERHT